MLVLEIIMMAFSVLFMVVGVRDYGIWTGQAPGGGLFPLIGGGLILICCIADIIMRIVKKQSLNGRMYEGEDEYIMLGFVPRRFRPLAVVIYGFFGILLLEYGGFVICSFFTCFIWLFAISKRTLLRSILISLATTAILYGIFVAWLNIPFPRGIF